MRDYPAWDFPLSLLQLARNGQDARVKLVQSIRAACVYADLVGWKRLLHWTRNLMQELFPEIVGSIPGRRCHRCGQFRPPDGFPSGAFDDPNRLHEPCIECSGLPRTCPPPSPTDQLRNAVERWTDAGLIADFGERWYRKVEAVREIRKAIGVLDGAKERLLATADNNPGRKVALDILFVAANEDIPQRLQAILLQNRADYHPIYSPMDAWLSSGLWNEVMAIVSPADPDNRIEATEATGDEAGHNRPDTPPSDPTEVAPVNPNVPLRWDRGKKQLLCGDDVLHTFRVAPEQFRVLDATEKAFWPTGREVEIPGHWLETKNAVSELRERLIVKGLTFDSRKVSDNCCRVSLTLDRA
jgi:hypothetical protein